ncbi:hypothetical protein SETIT_8G234700v2 [Setaria italica]|uniref:R13L1/DRL21-like LRR repeat region domain-containing protein n=1 Tax=Setaria italica TaxID=4555 RepID=A0A368SB26_SETIT|nr:hypothetical protein SETIT_8G234700v2 [Setaria italica]RCV39569.1 hypothetical protein SETIT_8G234700v2 [Setaria italica]
MAILQKTTSHQLIELNIKHLEGLSSSEANIIELAQKEELQFLSLEWSGPVFNEVALEELQPHENLKRLCIKNYVGGDFPNWLRLLPNLVRLELFDVQSGHLHLDYLQSLEDLYISSFPVINRPNDLNLYDKSSICILSTQPVKNLRRVTLGRVGKLLWKTSTLPCIEQKDDKNVFQREQQGGRHSDSGRESSNQRTLFPGLQYLEIDCCLNVRFEPSIPWSARYIISGIKQFPFLFHWPSFYQVMGLSTSALSSKMEIKYIENISSDSDSLQQLDIEELTVDSCIDPVPLPKCILGWKSLRKLEILNCQNMETLPEWLGDMASLRELKVETYWMKTLPPCIERLTSLHTLTLSQCTKGFKQRCSESGEDWSKIELIENVQVELRP